MLLPLRRGARVDLFLSLSLSLSLSVIFAAGGVIVCDNCQGTGIQPRFLERYSPDDFMD